MRNLSLATAGLLVFVTSAHAAVGISDGGTRLPLDLIVQYRTGIAPATVAEASVAATELAPLDGILPGLPH